MKAILEFNLPDDQIEFDYATNGSKWASLVWDLDQHLRNTTKHTPDDFPQEKYDALIELREYLHNELREQGLILR